MIPKLTHDACSYGISIPMHNLPEDFKNLVIKGGEVVTILINTYENTSPFTMPRGTGERALEIPFKNYVISEKMRPIEDNTLGYEYAPYLIDGVKYDQRYARVIFDIKSRRTYMTASGLFDGVPTFIVIFYKEEDNQKGYYGIGLRNVSTKQFSLSSDILEQWYTTVSSDKILLMPEKFTKIFESFDEYLKNYKYKSISIPKSFKHYLYAGKHFSYFTDRDMIADIESLKKMDTEYVFPEETAFRQKLQEDIKNFNFAGLPTTLELYDRYEILKYELESLREVKRKIEKTEEKIRVIKEDLKIKEKSLDECERDKKILTEFARHCNNDPDLIKEMELSLVSMIPEDKNILFESMVIY